MIYNNLKREIFMNFERNIINKSKSESIKYIGKDGKPYSTMKEKLVADYLYINSKIGPYMGEDGQEYSKLSDLIIANNTYWTKMSEIQRANEQTDIDSNDLNEIPKIRF